MSKFVIWLWSRRITSREMANAENSFKLDVIRHVNLLLIQAEMTLWWISDETASRTGSNAKMGFLTHDHDLRDTIMKVIYREIWYRTTESVRRQPVMTYVVQISKTFVNRSKLPSNFCSRCCQLNQNCPRSQDSILKKAPSVGNHTQNL